MVGMDADQVATEPAEHTGPEVAAGAESLSGGPVGREHTGREIAAGAESLSGGHVPADHLGPELTAGAESLSGEPATGG
ncbi:MAG: hypothetical protein ABJD68_18015 [Nakamurella sp.]